MTSKSKRPHSPDDGNNLDKVPLPPSAGAKRGALKTKKRSKMDSTLTPGNAKSLPLLQADTQPPTAEATNPDERNKSSPKDACKMNHQRTSSSFSSGPSSRISSEITSPEDTGNSSEIEVAKLRDWWTALHKKGRSCGQCNSEVNFESVTTETLRDQLDFIYRIKNAVRNAEKNEKHRKEMEDKAREDSISKLSRWGRGRKLGSGGLDNHPNSKSDPEKEKEIMERDNDKDKDTDKDRDRDRDRDKENIDAKDGKSRKDIKGKGKEREGKPGARKLVQIFGTEYCQKCRACICIACLKPVQAELDQKREDQTENENTDGNGSPRSSERSFRDDKKLWCCNEGRSVAILLCLGILDEEFLGLSASADSGTSSPNGKGIKGSIRRSLRSLKDKITDGPHPIKSPVVRTARKRSKVGKDKGTGYGSGTYHASVFGFDTSDSMDWDFPDDESDFDDGPILFSDLEFPVSELGIGKLTDKLAAKVAAYGPPLKPPPKFPESLLSPAPGHKLQPPSGEPSTSSPPAGPPLPHASSSAPPTPSISGSLGAPAGYHGLAGFAHGPSVANAPFSGPAPGYETPMAFKPYHYFYGPGKTLGGSAGGSSSAEEAVGQATDAVAPPLTEPALLLGSRQRVLKTVHHPFPPSSHNKPYTVHPDNSEQANALIEAVAAGSGFFNNANANPPGFWPIPHEMFPAIPSRTPRPLQGMPSNPPLPSKQIMHDKTFYAVIRTLSRLLSDSISEDEQHNLVPDVILSMLRASMIAEKMEELLRNDSIQDISIHSEVYLALIALLNRLSDNPSFEFLILENRRPKTLSLGLLKIAQSKPAIDLLTEIGPKTRGKTAAAVEEKRRAEVLIYEDRFSRQSIIDVMSKLSTQARVFLKCAGKAKGDEFEGIEAIKILKICMEIAAVEEKLLNLASRNASTKNRLSLASSKSIEVPPPQVRAPFTAPVMDLKYHDNMAFGYIEGVTDTHYWNIQANGLIDSPRGRVLHLSREMATMSTSLPQGVFIRVEDGRPDIMKALIVGPGETPYEGGLYEFDIWAPSNYPSGPPMCQFKTTGNGSVHFNPNLYNCGKVCLSILNTWSGASSERWQPGTSTLLQVFVSIQSMILCANPWYNEPGRREGTHKKDAEDFNNRVRVNNVKWAMLDWLKDSTKKNGIWKGVIETHFRANKGHLLDLVREWSKKESRITGSLANTGVSKWIPYEDATGIPQNFLACLEEELSKL